MQAGELAAEAVRVLVSHLASAADGGAQLVQGAATRLLSNLVEERLRETGHTQEWGDFTHNPANNSLVEYLLRQEATRDADFRLALGNTVQAARSEVVNGTQVRSINIGGDGDAQIGDRRDSFGENSRVVTGSGSYHEGDVTNNHDGDIYETHEGRPVGRYAMIAVLVLGLMVFAFKVVPDMNGGGAGGGLSSSSTCKEFLTADETTEQQAIVEIATDKGLGGFGSPLALPAIRYECSSHPTETLGAVIEQYKGKF
ncbi:hypothetical protein [Streptomyces hokutonensis]|uniref:hypothetical protein n=1 Tax=Streptomyces hokutonensis TaxID=1306990 RepID=UPI000360BFC2|nr:hypothetical protein [Streptomyces hokutonensis]